MNQHESIHLYVESEFSSFGGRKGKTTLAIALLGLRTPPPLVEN